MKTLHTADLHIKGDRSHKSIKVLHQIAEIAQDYDFVHINGDIFDGKSTPLQRLVFREFIDRLPKAFLMRGNHDEPLDVMLADYEMFCRVAESPQWMTHDGDYHVCAIPHFNAGGIAATAATIGGMTTNANEAFEAIIDNVINQSHGLNGTKVLTFHGVIKGARLDNDYIPRDNGICLDPSRLETFDGLCIGGHYHKFQSVGDSGKVWYSGSPVSHTYGEQGDKGVLSVDYSNGSPAVEFIKIEQRPMWNLKCRFEDGQIVWDDPLAAAAAQTGGDVKITCTVAKGDIPLLQADTIKLPYSNASDLVFEIDPIVTETVRSEAITATTTVAEAVAVWLYSSNYDADQIEHLMGVYDKITV